MSSQEVSAKLNRLLTMNVGHAGAADGNVMFPRAAVAEVKAKAVSLVDKFMHHPGSADFWKVLLDKSVLGKTYPNFFD
ncbi:hypothetical protein [Comamonas aquatica]|uniref:hypothetical protein n=1 Tax=Comamonas aquatica TaxID=225991 RepID=UPI001B38F299|nr:hypothetical protein [Comamonas aquatica]QTX21549.1 hypothetical protein KAQ61_03310 [Comamonas aquatica]